MVKTRSVVDEVVDDPSEPCNRCRQPARPGMRNLKTGRLLCDECESLEEEVRSGPKPFSPSERVAVVKSAIEEMQKFLEETGGCDHCVGICCCETIRTLDRLRQLEQELAAEVTKH